jgi:hypothetical protein
MLSKGKGIRIGLITHPPANPLYLGRLEIPAPAGFKTCFIQLNGNCQPGKALLPVSLDKPEVLVERGFVPQ